MNLNVLYSYLLAIWFIAAVVVFISLFFIKAPYGRHLRKGWGPTLNSLQGWMIMESPSSLLFAVLFIFGKIPKDLLLLAFFFLWEFHYVYRAFVYPFTLRDKYKKMPLVIVLMGLTFNLGNAFINGYYLFVLEGFYPDNWLLSSRFLIGLILFLSGLIINRRSDLVLRKLREPGETGYSIPYGGLFRWISCPNYLGEIIQWIGWGIATWSLPGFVFALWTIANLVPRALSHHKWYQENFSDYPQNRKALCPRIL